MNKISESVKEDIISLKTQGLTNEEIKKKTGVSTGKISEITNEFAARLQVNSPQEAFTFFKIIQKNKLTLDSAFKNIKTRSLLEKIGLSDDHASEILESFDRESKNSGLTIPEIVDMVETLGKISKDHDIKEKDLVDLIKEKEHQLETLKSKINEADASKKESEIDLDRTLKENNATIKDIQQYQNLQKKLQGNGLDINDLSCMVNMIEQSKSLNYDTEKIVAKIQESELLDDAIDRARAQNEELTLSNKDLEKSYADILEKKNANKSLVDVVEQLSLDGVTHDYLKQLHGKIIEIGKDNNLSSKDAAKMFYTNIQEQYHTKAGYESENQNLKNANQRLQMQNKELSDSQKQAIAKYQEQEKAIKFLVQLQKKGVNHHSITKWEETAKNLGMTPAQFQQNMKTLSDLEKIIQDKQKICNEAEQKVSILNAKKKELSTQVDSLRAQRDKIVNLKEIIQKVTNLSMKTCQSTIHEYGTHRIKGETDSIIQEIHSAFADIDNMEEKHAKAREDIARADVLRPFYNILTNKGDLEQIWFPLHSLLVCMEIKIPKENTRHNILRSVKNLKESVYELLLSNTQS